ncbi:hypothetical protein ACJVC5_08310 [Peredibacter sp. HCB2-198]|uniref:hypothetical protein n=1 Tax=Peredibacter sp. HCB2-198 TaxID=3383025 RepID=UPI0038B5B1E2
MRNLLMSSVVALTMTSSAFAICPQWTAKRVGSLDKNMIDEASGLVTSVLQKGKFIWVNDSGAEPVLYATGMDGKVVRKVKMANFPNTDFEAMAMGPCPSNRGESCIYVGDIGSGMGWRSSLKIGIFKEKDFWSFGSIRPEYVIETKYPNGVNNSEAMVVTPEGQILFLSKAEGNTQIFVIAPNGRMSLVASVDTTKMLTGTRGKGPLITDAAISPDGDKLLMLSYSDIIEVNLKSLVGITQRQWKPGVDFNVIKGPGLPQQETVTYDGQNSFIISSESEEEADGAPQIYSYTCNGF